VRKAWVLFSAVAMGVWGYGAEAAEPSEAARFSLTYGPSLPLSGSYLKLDRTQHHVGFEIAAGSNIRYHAAFLYGNLVGQSMARLEPLSFGLPIGLFEDGDSAIDLEPLVSVFNVEFALGRDSSELLFSSGVRLQINIAVDNLYVGLVPLGLDIRYLGRNSVGGSAKGDLALAFRPQIFVGVNFN